MFPVGTLLRYWLVPRERVDQSRLVDIPNSSGDRRGRLKGILSIV